jgi:hypothetical protein
MSVGFTIFIPFRFLSARIFGRVKTLFRKNGRVRSLGSLKVFLKSAQRKKKEQISAAYGFYFSIRFENSGARCQATSEKLLTKHNIFSFLLQRFAGRDAEKISAARRKKGGNSPTELPPIQFARFRNFTAPARCNKFPRPVRAAARTRTR